MTHTLKSCKQKVFKDTVRTILVATTIEQAICIKQAALKMDRFANLYYRSIFYLPRII